MCSLPSPVISWRQLRGWTAGPPAKAGLVSVAFGVVLFAHPRIGAFALALLFGLYALVYGSR